MPATCCIKDCKSRWKKNSKIKFYRFPFKDKTAMKYWIAATGRNNWFPYSRAQICSLHFKDNDYYDNKEHIERRHLIPGVIPTQNVHRSILQVFQQNAHILQISQLEKINEYDQCNAIDQNKEALMDQEHNEIVIASPIYDQGNTIDQNKEALMDQEHNEIVIASPIYDQGNAIDQNKEALMDQEHEIITASSKCLNCDKLLNTIIQLKQKIHEFQKLMEKRLDLQASMFRKLINEKEAALKGTLGIVRTKNKMLNKNIQRKRKKITNMKTLFKELKDKNMLEDNTAINMVHEFENLVPLLQKEKKKYD